MFTFASAQKRRQDAQFCGDFPLVLLKHIAETTHISASHHAERIKLKKKYRYTITRAFTFASAQKRNGCFLLATRATRRSVLRRLSSRTFEAHRRDNAHLRFSSRRAHEIEEETCRYILSSPVACSLLRVHRRGTKRHERRKFSKTSDF